MFGANVMGILGFGGFDGIADDAFEVGGAAERADNEGFLFVVAVNGFELIFDVVGGDLGVFEDAGGDALVVFEDGEEYVLGANVLLAVLLGE